MIFSNILDVQEFTSNIINSIEDAIESCEEGSLPEIGVIFEELAEVSFVVFYEVFWQDSWFGLEKAMFWYMFCV